MFTPEQNTRSVPAGNKTINAALYVDGLNDRFEDMMRKDVYEVLWPSQKFVECCHAMVMEPFVTDISAQAASTTGDGLLNIMTTFNNLCISKVDIDVGVDELKAEGELTQSHIDLLNEYNDGMWYCNDYVNNTYAFTTDEVNAIKRAFADGKASKTPVMIDKDKWSSKLLYLIGCKRADNANKWIENRYQFMGIVKTEAMLEQNRIKATQKCTGWMGGVCDVWHNNPTLDKMIEVGQHLYYRYPKVLPTINGTIMSESTVKDNMRFAGAPVEKATLILETFKDNQHDFLKRRFISNLFVRAYNMGVNAHAQGKINTGKYHKMLDDDDDNIRQKVLYPFEDELIKFMDMYAGKAYSNALYGEYVTIVLKSQTLF